MGRTLWRSLRVRTEIFSSGKLAPVGAGFVYKAHEVSQAWVELRGWSVFQVEEDEERWECWKTLGVWVILSQMAAPQRAGKGSTGSGAMLGSAGPLLSCPIHKSRAGLEVFIRILVRLSHQQSEPHGILSLLCDLLNHQSERPSKQKCRYCPRNT